MSHQLQQGITCSPYFFFSLYSSLREDWGFTPVTVMARPWITYMSSVDIHIRALKPNVRLRDAISCDSLLQ